MYRSRRFHHLITHYLINALSSSDFDNDHLDCLNRKDYQRMTGKRLSLKTDEFANQKKLLGALRGLQLRKSDTELLRSNCTLLAQHMGLSDVAKELLVLLVIIPCNQELAELLDRSSMSDDGTQFVADIVGLTLPQLSKAARELSKCSLFKKDFIFARVTYSGLPAAPDALVACLSEKKYRSFKELASHLLFEAPAPSLELQDFEHVETSVLTGLLKHAGASRSKGMNILIYGTPGTGKTELTRAIAQHLAYSLYEVHPIGGKAGEASEEIDAIESSGPLRLQYFQLVQAICAEYSRSMVIVDECEDIFSDYRLGTRFSKMTTHSLLDENPLPTVWITNDITVFSDSHLRRFTYVMELGKPPKSVIGQIIQSNSKGLRLTDDFMQELTYTKGLTPASVANTFDVARCLKAKGAKAEGIIHHVMDNFQAATGEQQTSYKQAMSFDEQLINLKGTKEQLSHIRQGIEQLMDVRVLMTGPPGTGKTGYIHYLAEALETELITAKCSDILSMYVGGSEQNVAKLFREATASQAILFLDEVDSLLMSRNTLNRSYEVQLVNELLQQIEQFEYPLFAATNHAKSLDHAVARRFDFKLEFDYLNPKQVLLLFKELTEAKTLSAPISSKLSALTHLTPGDFAILKRRNRYTNKPLTALEATQILEQENARKQSPKTIGFIN